MSLAKEFTCCFVSQCNNFQDLDGEVLLLSKLELMGQLKDEFLAALSSCFVHIPKG
jgi:hypothetical protein